MAQPNDEDDLRRANFRLCRLCTWPNYTGLGFNLENASTPPHIIRTVESNSPAAAGGLKILDLVLAVNNQNVSDADYKTVTETIKNVRDRNERIELLVIEKRFYAEFKNRGVSFDSQFANVIETPRTMPRDYTDFPKYTPRTCEIRLNKNDSSFGFEVINGARDIGAFVQEVIPNSPAGQTPLRKSDRILEIDDKFVDNDPSQTILEKLFKAKKKRVVKLYVVDTNTYKYFQENKIPLISKEFRKTKFAAQPQPPTSTYINVEDVSIGPKTADVDILRPTFRDNYQSQISVPVNTQESHQDDIRLCTINRANPTDPYGIELNYHKKDQYHSLKLTSGRNNEPSNAALAGVKPEDHLIEINGENIEHVGDDQVKQRIRANKYPQPLQILVADPATYNHYKQQNKVIHSGLPTVNKLPENVVGRSAFIGEPGLMIVASRESVTESTVIAMASGDKKPSPGITDLVNNNPIQSRVSIESSQSNRRQYQLQRIPGFTGYGFSVNSNQAGSIAHKITQIAPNSPAAQQGLHVGDQILTVNGQNVEKMSALDFNQFLRASAQNADAQGNPLLLEVISEYSYQPPILRDDFSRPTEPISSQYESRKSPVTQPTVSPDRSRKSSARSQPTVSPGVSRKSSTRIQPTVSPDGSRKSSTRIQPTVSPDGSRKSTTIQPIPYQNGGRKLTATQLPANQSYLNGYNSSPHDRYSQPEIKPIGTSSSSLYGSRGHLSRGTVDIVSKNRLLRYCRLSTGTGQTFGFQLKPDDDRHAIHNIEPDSPAARAGLYENDLLVEIDDENIENKSKKEIANLIRNAGHAGTLRLLIAPHSVKVLSKRSTKSLTLLNGDRYYRDMTSQLKYDDHDQLSSTNKYQSVPRIYGKQNYRDLSSSDYSSEPTEPLPRKCVLRRDPSFRGCGFRLIEKENYDTPIIVEIFPDSPAKRSGLTEGDHIIYVDLQNVQNFRSFNDITYLIQHTFEENGQITLVTLTGPAYQVLKRRGGHLESTAFDYQTSVIDQLKPRLCKLKLSNHEHDFGFSLQHNDDILYVNNVEQSSSADVYGLREGDIVLELNGKTAKYLTIHQIKEITDTSKQEQKLDILVIDIGGYRYSMKHAIPLNSLLSFVQTKEERATTTNNRTQRDPVYL